MERRTKPAISRLRLPFFKRLKRQGARASDITNASSDAFILFDRNLDIVGMNPLARSMFHLILGENVIGEDVPTGAPNMKPDNKNNGRSEKYLNAIRKGKPFFADSIVIHSGLLDINLKAEAFKVGKGFGIIFSDLDALKKAEKTPYDSQKGLAINLQNVPDCIFIFDLRGTVLHGSRAGERLTGYAWEEIKGRSLFEIPLFAPEYMPKAAQLLELSASGKPAGPDEFELIRKDGSHVFVEISTCPIGGGEEREIVGIAHDITERKQSEEALRKSEEKYEAIVETSLDGIYQVDTSGKFTFINESFASTFGYKREELLGKQFSSLLSAEIIPKVVGMVKEVLSGKNVRDEVPVQHKDGHEVLVNFGATPLKDRGKIVGLTGVLRDVTERNKAKEEIQSLARFPSENPYPVLRVAKDGKVLYSNKAALELLAEWKTKIGEKVPGRWCRLIEEAFESGEPRSEEEEVKDKIFSLEIALIKESGYVNLYGYDITERKHAVEELANSEAKYRSLIETAGAGVATTNLKGEFVLVNEALCRMTGYSQEESLGRSFADFLHPDDKNEVLEIFAQGLAGERKPPHLEFRVIHKDGHNVWCYSTPTAIAQGNELIGFSAIIYDITKRKQAEEALRDSEERFRSILENAPFGYYSNCLQCQEHGPMI